MEFQQIYTNREERKQRNRQAQSDFRKRREAYINRLETSLENTKKELEDQQEADRVTADEVVLLRYQNSLLERVLFEKGEEGRQLTSQILLIQWLGVDTQPQLETHQQQPSHFGLAVPVSRRDPQQQLRNTLGSAPLNGNGNTADSQGDPGHSSHHAHMDKLGTLNPSLFPIFNFFCETPC